MKAPTRIYTDGSTIGRNPSTTGGTWAFCWVDENGERFGEASGVVVPADMGKPVVTNNDMEFLAALLALENVFEGWAGTLWTDSKVTRSRILGGRKSHPPAIFLERLAAVKGRLGFFAVLMLAGHPTQADLKRGTNWLGVPVSEHNCFCDALCQEESARHLGRLSCTA